MQMDFPFDGGGDGRGSQIEIVALHEAARARYLNYALSVITSRALPDVRDGLKPVQRRILYTMYRDLKLRADSRYLKSARVVGDVMGKYHPHGDQSIYDAMVRMAQDFSLRYPLVDGQGNFGSIDGDPPAAMRYTEARLYGVAEDLLSELGQGTVDYRQTYDGQLSEPVVLPAQVPNLLVNGASGIAVGMATNIPPHNMREVVDALIAMIDDPDIDHDELCRHVRAPDFPTAGEILNTPEELSEIYRTGQGPVRVRGSYTTEVVNRRRCILLTSVPYGTNKGALVERIGALIAARKVPQIIDVRDESTDDVRVVLELKRGAKAEVAMAYLYKHTPLSGNFHVNLTCLVPTEHREVCAPLRVGLREMLRHFLDFRMEVVTRRLRHRLEKLRQAIHRLEAFEIIFDALDEVIALIRKSEGKADAAVKLMARFDIDDEQADAILELKLYRLARLELLMIETDLREKREEAARIEGLLADAELRWGLVRDELVELRDTYGDERRTQLVGPEAKQDFDPEAYIVRERTWVIVSRQGRVKRQKGFSEVSAIRVPEGDEIGWVLRSDTHHTVTFYTQLGSAYTLRIDDIVATTGYGDPVQASFAFKDGERIVGVSCSDTRLYPPVDPEVLPPPEEDAPPPPHGIAVTRGGKVVRFPFAAHAEVSTRSGRRYVGLGRGDAATAVFYCAGDENVALATEGGRVLIFPAADVPAKSNAVRGVNAIKLDPSDLVLGFALAKRKREGLKTLTNRGRELIVRETSYRPVKRGGKGNVVIRLGKLVSCEYPLVLLQPPTGEDDVVGDEMDEAIEGDDE